MPAKAKYSLLLSETKLYHGKMVYRIQANNSFGTVKRFQKGGWIEDENNLSHSGTCWVSDDAIVCGNAKVMDDAQVQQTAVVHQNAQVSGCAKISDNARVRGNAKVFGYARVYGNACLKDNAKAFGSCDIFGKALIYENAEISGSAEISGVSQIGGNDKIELGIYKDYKTHRSPSDKVRLNTDTGVLETLDDKGNKIVPLDKTKLASILKRLKIDTSDVTLNQFKNCITLRNRKTLISVLRNLLPNEKLETIKVMSKKILNEYYEVTANCEGIDMKKIIALSEDRLDNSTKALYEVMNEGSFQYNYRTDDNFQKFLNTTMLDEIKDVIRSDKNLIKKCVEKRVQSYSIVWDALVRIFVYVIKQHNLRAKLSTDKIKNWFAFNNTDYKTALQPLVKDIEYGFRNELRETEK